MTKTPGQQLDAAIEVRDWCFKCNQNVRLQLVRLCGVTVWKCPHCGYAVDSEVDDDDD